jgi:hypothetical protein
MEGGAAISVGALLSMSWLSGEEVGAAVITIIQFVTVAASAVVVVVGPPLLFVLMALLRGILILSPPSQFVVAPQAQGIVIKMGVDIGIVSGGSGVGVLVASNHVATTAL